MAAQDARISRDWVGSSSTTHSQRPASIFSDYDIEPSSDMTSPATSLRDDYEIVEISKKDFKANTKKRKRSSRAPTPRVIKGSTYGGIDPLHALLKSSGIEPQHWREERQRRVQDARQASRRYGTLQVATPPSKYLKPERYEKLPFSPQDYFTSGLDLDSDSETRESFWRRVTKGWEASCKRESVEARRRRFGKL